MVVVGLLGVDLSSLEVVDPAFLEVVDLSCLGDHVDLEGHVDPLEALVDHGI